MLKLERSFPRELPGLVREGGEREEGEKDTAESST